MIRFNEILDKISPLYSEKEIQILQKAYVFAAQAHKGQIRRSGEPYLSHPLEVANMLADMKLDVTTLTAGLLHDVLEDTDVTAPELKKAFGADIFHLVEGVTKISLVQESTPEIRHEETIRKIILAMTDDLRVIFIKLVDRIHNLKTLKYLDEKKQKRIAEETLELYAPIANRLGMGRIKAELEDLSFRYVDPENFFKISSLIDPLRKEAEKGLKDIKNKLEALMEENHIKAEIFFRIKRPYSIYNKMKRRDISFDQVYDFMALRLFTESVEQCYSALGVIHQHFTHIPFRFRDFIAMPKPNIYQALHTTIITKKKQNMEIQIRTYYMHDLAENGIAAHWKYKESHPQDIMKEDKRLQWLREMVELYKEQKSPREFLKSLKTDLIPEEVYVYTPKGKVIALPLGATVLDFAFKIHTEIGLHSAEAKIDGKSVSLKTVLKPGSIVEIITSEESFPARAWLNVTFTSNARYQIKRWLAHQEKIKNTAIGKELWKKQSVKYRIPAVKLKEKYLLGRISETCNFKVRKIEDFYALIGFGKVILNKKLMQKFFPQEILPDKKKPLIDKIVTKVTKKPRPAIQVKGTAEDNVNLAKCCSPIKGEPIIGYITSGKGIHIHAQRCPYVRKEILVSQRIIDATWDESGKGLYKGVLRIECEDLPGVLAKLTAAIAQLKGNISKANVNTTASHKGQIKLTIMIRDIKHLEKIIKKIADIKEVYIVERI